MTKIKYDAKANTDGGTKCNSCFFVKNSRVVLQMPKYSALRKMWFLLSVNIPCLVSWAVIISALWSKWADPYVLVLGHNIVKNKTKQNKKKKKCYNQLPDILCHYRICLYCIWIWIYTTRWICMLCVLLNRGVDQRCTDQRCGKLVVNSVAACLKVLRSLCVLLSLFTHYGLRWMIDTAYKTAL